MGYQVRINSTMSKTIAASRLSVHYNAWLKWTDEMNRKAPEGCSFTFASWKFRDMATQSVLLSTALLGAVLSGIFAFLILFVVRNDFLFFFFAYFFSFNGYSLLEMCLLHSLESLALLASCSR